MNTSKLTIEIRMRWWTRFVIIFFALVTFILKKEPSDKIIDWIANKGFTFKGPKSSKRSSRR